MAEESRPADGELIEFGPQAVDGYTRSANLETQLSIAGEAQQVGQASAGRASGVVSAAAEIKPVRPGGRRFPG